MLISTVATLAVAALALLPDLESQLRTEAQATLLQEVKGETGTFTHLTPEAIADANVPAKPSSSSAASEPATTADPVLKNVTALSVRAGATISLFGYPQILIASAGVGGSTSSLNGAVVAAFRTGRTAKSFGSGASGNVAQVAVPIRIDSGKGPTRTFVLAASRTITEIQGVVNVVLNAFETAALAGIALTLILGIPLSATLLRRLQRLRTAALRLAQGAPTVEIPVDRAGDEVGDLTRTFAIMQRRLAQQEEARRAFVSTASHELRTPLTSLHGMLELLDDDLQGPNPDLPDARRLLTRARAQSRRLSRLASDLLDLSRLDAEVELRSEPVELGELSRAVLAEFEPRNADRELTARLEDDAAPCWALGDPGSVAQILRILLDNAVQLSPPNSEIRVELHNGDGAVVTPGGPGPPSVAGSLAAVGTRNGSDSSSVAGSLTAVAVSVSDSGPGVDPQERQLIFNRFHRGRQTAGSAGFGLGLAIGRELAERMGGELVLEDTKAPGATFTLRLPAVRARDGDAVAAN
ncbi:MAG TPA: HAMP domain-containing sensor histidine kinase [Solirubrobacteraceae bacterium]